MPGENRIRENYKFVLGVLVIPLLAYGLSLILYSSFFSASYPQVSSEKFSFVIWVVALIFTYRVLHNKYISSGLLESPRYDELNALIFVTTTTIPLAISLNALIAKPWNDVLPVFLMQEVLALSISTLSSYLTRFLPQFEKLERVALLLDQRSNEIESNAKRIEEHASETLEGLTVQSDALLQELRKAIASSEEVKLSSAVFNLDREVKKYLSNGSSTDEPWDRLTNSADIIYKQRKKVGQVLANIHSEFESKPGRSTLRSVSLLSLFASYYEYEGLTFDANPIEGIVTLSTRFDHYAEAVMRMMAHVSLLNSRTEKDGYSYEFHLFTNRTPQSWFLQTLPSPLLTDEESLGQEIHPPATLPWIQFIDFLANDQALKDRCFLNFATLEDNMEGYAGRASRRPALRANIERFLDETFLVCRVNEESEAGNLQPVVFHDSTDELAYPTVKKANEDGISNLFVSEDGIDWFKNLDMVDQAHEVFPENHFYGSLRAQIEDQVPNAQLRILCQKGIKFLAIGIHAKDIPESHIKLTINGDDSLQLTPFRAFIGAMSCTVNLRSFKNILEFEKSPAIQNLPNNLFAIKKVMNNKEKVDASDAWIVAMGAQGQYTGQSAVNLVYSTKNRQRFGKHRHSAIDWDQAAKHMDKLFTEGLIEVEKTTGPAVGRASKKDEPVD